MRLKQLPEDFIVIEQPLFQPKKTGDYFLYRLEKKSYNTERVIQFLSKKYKIERKLFSYAGTKDKNAVTTQYFTCKKHLPDTKEENYCIKYIGKLEHPLSLGDHAGNKFIITIRDITKLPRNNVEFVNYFGKQRFGRHNFEIGLTILKRNFEQACSYVDRQDVQEHLKKNPNDYVGALQKIPFKILKIYVHSVQSFFWNKVAEKIKIEKIPLISFDTDFENKDVELMYEKLLDKYELSLRDFVIRQFNNLTPQGSYRKRIAEVSNLNIGNLEDDELNKEKKKVTVEVILGKGSYATVFIDSLYA
jgi:tRNA pseudouridine13 synthase